MMILCLLAGFQQAIIVVYFNLNQEAIEQAFCVNKDKPALECHGNCHLKKQLEKTKNTALASIDVYHKVDMLCSAFTEFDARNVIIEIQARLPSYKEIHYKEPYCEIFVPPPAS